MIYRRFRLRSPGGGVHWKIAKACRPVKVVRRHGRPQERTVQPRKDRDVRAASQVPDQAGVPGGQVAPDIARHRGDGEDLKGLRRGEGQQKSDGVVDAGIAVDDEG